MRTAALLIVGCCFLWPLATLRAGKDDKPSGSMIIMFNGKAVEGVESTTKDKAFKPVFEKELEAVSQKLEGKPALKLTHWYTVINGCAIHCTKGDEKTFAQLKTTLEKLPYVKMVEYDRPVKIDLPK